MSSMPPPMDDQTIEVYRDGELVETRTVVVPARPVSPEVAALRAEIEAMKEASTERAAVLAEAADAALDPASTVDRRVTLRARIKAIIDAATLGSEAGR